MNNLNNLPPFYIGQKVVYITGINMPKNSIHIVTDIWKDICGCWNIYIDNEKIKLVSPEYTHIECNVCGKIIKNNILIREGWASTSFRPLKYQSFPLLTYSKILEEVEVSAN